MKKLFIILILILAGSLPALAQQQPATPAVGSTNVSASDSHGGSWVGDYNLLEPGLVGKSGTDAHTSDFQSYASLFFTTMLTLIVMLSIVMIVFGGVKYIYGQAPNQKAEGGSTVVNALSGLVLALVSWLILYSINPNLVTTWNIGIQETTGGTGKGDPLAPGTPPNTNPRNPSPTLIPPLI
jgi:hypothetical protein